MTMVIRQATTGVSPHPNTTFLSIRRLTVLTPRMMPIPSTAPTVAWDVDTGTPIHVKIWVVKLMAKTTIKAEKGSTLTSLRPTVSITGRLKVRMPRAMLNPPRREAVKTLKCPAPTKTAETLATLFAPKA